MFGYFKRRKERKDKEQQIADLIDRLEESVINGEVTPHQKSFHKDGYYYELQVIFFYDDSSLYKLVIILESDPEVYREYYITKGQYNRLYRHTKEGIQQDRIRKAKQDIDDRLDKLP